MLSADAQLLHAAIHECIALKIVITGASGFVGRQLVPQLRDAGADLLLIGRDADLLRRTFPDMRVATYADLAEAGRGYDQLLHLAVLNNDQTAEAAEFTRVNVDLMVETLHAAKAAGIGHFVNVSSFHALEEGKSSPYARSKRAALAAAEGVDGIVATTLFLPAVHGARFSGKMGFLNGLPALLQRPLFHLMAALAPTVHVGRIADWLTDRADTAPREVFLSDGQEGHVVYHVLKRAVDYVFAFVILGLFWWALLLVWLLVRFGSPGPGIFAQTRVGRWEEPFTCLKFRTMQKDTVQAGTHEVSSHSVTPIGHFLRRTKVDELPQAWNILRGEISLVGPRPGLPVQTELTAARRVRDVYRALPGISGLAQISGIDMSDPEKLARWDALYIARRSLLLDLKIILRTALGSGQGDKTY